MPTTRATLPGAIRLLDSHADREACVELQRRVWGEAYRDTVPASVIKVTGLVGGVSAGAFDDDGSLVGFVYGITGPMDGILVHWSHMLGVAPEWRGRALGRRLKLFQRRIALEHGVTVMKWTFDPLVAENAHFNLNQLGVAIESYQEEMYGDTGSDLHDFGTDRMVARWELDRPVSPPPESARDWSRVPVLNPATPWQEPPPALPQAGEGSGRLRIRIPSNILAVQEQEAGAAGWWRASTRAAFLQAQATGYRTVGFQRAAPGEDFAHFLLATAPG